MMRVEQNIGILNALIRIMIGLTVLSWSTAKLVKKSYCRSYLWAAMCGAMKVAEGIVRYCPVTALIQKGQDNIQLQKKNNPNESHQTFDETVPCNPT